MKYFFLLALLSALSADPEGLEDKIDSVVFCSGRADGNIPVVHTDISAIQLRSNSPSASLPMCLEMQPSVVSTNEGGTGLGYSNLRVRGIGGTQTNVTLNGITLNDAESQEVFWVNLPSLANVLGSVQLQRGLGTSSCGPGAFGASVNMVTEAAAGGLRAGALLGYGSFNTFSGSVRAFSGTLPCGFFAGGAYSFQRTDGYIDNAGAKVQSIYGQAGWADGRNSVKFTYLGGIQRTGITWNGVPFEIYPENPRYNPSVGDTDNYRQSHFQLNYIHTFGKNLSWNTTFNYTDGYGYYEISGARDVLDNGLYVLKSDLTYDTRKLKVSGGIYISEYDGRHSGGNYTNDAVKKEADVRALAEWNPCTPLTVYADIQYRAVSYMMKGPDEYRQTLDYNLEWNFFNPRAGISFRPGQRHRLYASAALGHREPARADFQASKEVKPETLLDIEAGYVLELDRFSLEINLYAMEYRDMLLETGIVNDSGYPVKSNVPKGWRRGVECSLGWRICSWLEFGANGSAGSNRISSGNALPLSPAASGAAYFSAKCRKGFSARLSWKCVGRQYWDSSGQENRTIPAYDIAELRLAKEFRLKTGKLALGIDINNLLDRHCYSYAHSGGVFPIAPFNAGLTLGYDL